MKFALTKRLNPKKNTISTVTVTWEPHMFLNHVSQRVLFFLSTRPVSHDLITSRTNTCTPTQRGLFMLFWSCVESDGDINVFHNFITNQKWSLRAIRNICWDIPAALQHFRFSYTEKYLEVPACPNFIYLLIFLYFVKQVLMECPAMYW